MSYTKSENGTGDYDFAIVRALRAAIAAASTATLPSTVAWLCNNENGLLTRGDELMDIVKTILRMRE